MTSEIESRFLVIGFTVGKHKKWEENNIVETTVPKSKTFQHASIHEKRIITYFAMWSFQRGDIITYPSAHVYKIRGGVKFWMNKFGVWSFLNNNASIGLLQTVQKMCHNFKLEFLNTKRLHEFIDEKKKGEILCY